MTVSVEGLRSAADFMRQQTCIDPKWLRDAADEIERLRRRVTVLEMVIRQDLHVDDCSDEANRMIVEEIDDRQSP